MNSWIHPNRYRSRPTVVSHRNSPELEAACSWAVQLASAPGAGRALEAFANRLSAIPPVLFWLSLRERWVKRRAAAVSDRRDAANFATDANSIAAARDWRGRSR